MKDQISECDKISAIKKFDEGSVGDDFAKFKYERLYDR